MKRALLALLALAASSGPAPAEEAKLREVAAAVLGKHGDTVATVKMTVVHRTLVEKKEVHRSEHPIEVAGTVLSAEGLVVISASALDFLPGLSLDVPLKDEKLETEFERKQTRIRYADGREVAAQLLGRDAERDLAFLKPLVKRKGLAYLSLDKTHPRLTVASPALVVYSLTRLLHRRPAVAIRAVSAVAEHKGKLAVLDSSQLRLLGCPVFDGTGRPVGIATTLRPLQTPHAFLGNFENLEPDIVVMDAAAVRAALAEVTKKSGSGK